MLDDQCSRKNENGVDLNRNYDSHFGSLSLSLFSLFFCCASCRAVPFRVLNSADPAGGGGPVSRVSDSFPGKKPFSERATALVRQALQEFQPAVFMCVRDIAPPSVLVCFVCVCVFCVC